MSSCFQSTLCERHFGKQGTSGFLYESYMLRMDDVSFVNKKKV